MNIHAFSKTILSKRRKKIIKWFTKNWIAIVALIVAVIGGLPGLLQIIEHFRPFILRGSIKFYAPTVSTEPPQDGIIVALTLLNEGSKDLVWRKLDGVLTINGKDVSLTPTLIPENMMFNNQKAPEKDLLKQQVFVHTMPLNGYLHFTAPYRSVGAGYIEPSKLCLRFELESARIVDIELPFVGSHPIKKGETFPTHDMKF